VIDIVLLLTIHTGVCPSKSIQLVAHVVYRVYGYYQRVCLRGLELFRFRSQGPSYCGFKRLPLCNQVSVTPLI
jgi:hypothetical protein